MGCSVETATGTVLAVDTYNVPGSRNNLLDESGIMVRVVSSFPSHTLTLCVCITEFSKTISCSGVTALRMGGSLARKHVIYMYSNWTVSLSLIVICAVSVG